MPAAMPIYFLSRVLEARYCRRLVGHSQPARIRRGGAKTKPDQCPHVICRETEKVPIFARNFRQYRGHRRIDGHQNAAANLPGTVEQIKYWRQRTCLGTRSSLSISLFN